MQCLQSDRFSTEKKTALGERGKTDLKDLEELKCLICNLKDKSNKIRRREAQVF